MVTVYRSTIPVRITSELGPGTSGQWLDDMEGRSLRFNRHGAGLGFGGASELARDDRDVSHPSFHENCNMLSLS